MGLFVTRVVPRWRLSLIGSVDVFRNGSQKPMLLFEQLFGLVMLLLDVVKSITDDIESRPDASLLFDELFDCLTSLSKALAN